MWLTGEVMGLRLSYHICLVIQCLSIKICVRNSTLICLFTTCAFCQSNFCVCHSMNFLIVVLIRTLKSNYVE